ncbi:MAG: Fic family protein [Bacteroidetes bacterium]|nr:Fic family protein [Bacteroidota bacterium]
MEALLKQARKNKNLRIREVAEALSIDQALISKFESGARLPTKTQLQALSNFLEIPFKDLMMAWLEEKIWNEVKNEPFLSETLQLLNERAARYFPKTDMEVSEEIYDLLTQIDEKKEVLQSLRKYDSYKIAQALEMEYTFESNKIEGNTLTLRETDLVVNEGLTISGKSMREHLEAINHTEAIEFIKDLLSKEHQLTERDVLQVHHLILKSIDSEMAGRYRNVQVMIKGSAHTPPQPYLVPKQMEDYFIWYNQNKNRLHPVLLAAEMHERLVTIHPFIDGNGRTSRLVMNFILLQNGFVIANLKGDFESRTSYYNALEKVQVGKGKDSFLLLIAKAELDAIERYIQILGG